MVSVLIKCYLLSIFSLFSLVFFYTNFCIYKKDNIINKRLILIILSFVHVINLGDDLPRTIKLDERVEVCVVGADRILLHVDTHYRCSWCNSEYVDSCLDIRRSSVFLDKAIEVFDRTAKYSPLVKPYITASL